MKNVCNYGEYLVSFVSSNNKTHTYEGSVSGKNSWVKLVFIVSDVIRSLASMRITCLMQCRYQGSSSALMIPASLLSVEKS